MILRMKTLLDLIDYNKRKSQKNLKKARNEYVSVIYYGLMQQKTLKDIHRDIQKVTEINNKQGIDTTPLIKYVYNLCDKTKKRVDGLSGATDLIIADWLYRLFHKKQVFTETNTLIYDYAKRVEEKDKTGALREELDRGRKEEKIFYLASSHKDCAIDHKDYQGKIYVDENWKKYVSEKDFADVSQFIIMNNIQTFQWVIGNPVWLITRPNCRHYFKAMTTKEVLTKDANTLIRNHKMNHKKGNKITQTLNYKRKEMRKENIISLIQRYEERLEYHKSLYERNKRVQILKRAIEKDKLLIKKWKEYLSKMY